mmetsp:Transcript_34328/g.72278  ORF Transcript_34328/g.72278 Transcript_34328/m.72278 type:complete len:134 (-) Transcript_34328:464-865(-)
MALAVARSNLYALRARSLLARHVRNAFYPSAQNAFDEPSKAELAKLLHRTHDAVRVPLGYIENANAASSSNLLLIMQQEMRLALAAKDDEIVRLRAQLVDAEDRLQLVVKGLKRADKLRHRQESMARQLLHDS